MSTVQTRPECGRPLPSGAAPWLCPNCLLAQAVDPTPEPELTSPFSAAAGRTPAAGASAEGGETFPQRFGDYELLAQIGRGGMGIVYKARQTSLDRLVALKVLPPGVLATKEQVLRFRTEAAAAGSLQHPNIVAIHEVGLCEDRHYLAMDLVEGQTLAELAARKLLPPRHASVYVQKIAEAVHYAHEGGILHRDLKPSNVLIDADDEPRVTDFGLAKRLESTADLTLSGQVLGSPQYMPPEQAAGRQRQVGRSSDVYSLGAILYHLLAGRPPFGGETLSDVLPQVINDEPLRPRQLNPAVPADLETICLKCLEKETGRRYPSALALAEELGRFLRSEPIMARPVGWAGKAWRWCRRNPRLAASVGFAVLSLVVGVVGIAWEWRQAEAQRARAEANEYVLSINAAQQALNANNPGRALGLLNRYGQTNASRGDPRGFEWRYLWPQCQSEAEAVIGKLGITVRSLDVSADGRWLYAGAQRAEPKVWELATGKPFPLGAEGADWAWGTFSPDGRFLLIAPQTMESYGTISVWDMQARRKVAPIIDGRPIGPIVFSADGRRFGYGVVLTKGLPGAVLMEWPSRKRITEIHCTTNLPDRQRGWDGVFTPDGQSFIWTDPSSPGSICLWPVTPGSEPRKFPAHNEPISAMTISPDGKMLATGEGYTQTAIKLWEFPSFRPLGDLRGHSAWITALKFSPDGRTLASAAADQTMRLWDVSSKTQKRIFPGLPTDVYRLCFAGDGQKLFSGSEDGTIHRWSIDGPEPEHGPLRQRSAGLNDVVVAPDARRFAGLRQGGVWLGQLAAGAGPSEIPELGTNNTCLLFSAEGKSLLSGTHSGEIRVWSLDRGKVLRRLPGLGRPVNALREDGQGRTLVAIHQWGRTEPNGRARPVMDFTVEVQAWRTQDWQVQAPWILSGPWGIYAVSPDGRRLAADGSPGTIQVRTLFNPAQTNVLAFGGTICGIVFSPDGRLLVAANREGTVKTWETPRFQSGKEFRARPHGLFALAFSPDSRRLATAGEGTEAIKLWDVATWQELITLPQAGKTLQGVVFSTDGGQLIGRTDQGELLFWRAPSFAEIERGKGKITAR